MSQYIYMSFLYACFYVVISYLFICLFFPPHFQQKYSYTDQPHYYNHMPTAE